MPLRQRQKVQKMLREECIMAWYVIQVRTGSELVICEKIRQRVSDDLWEDCFVPQVEKLYKKEGKYRKVVAPLFPGYVFIVCEEPGPVMSALRKVSDFTKLLKTGDDFEALSDYEVDTLLTLAGINHTVEMSVGYIEGDKVYITSGPMVGQEGAVLKINRHKRQAEVEISFLGRPTKVSLPLEIVSKTP